MPKSILVLNTGSTSTKIAVYLDKELAVQKEYKITEEELKQHPFMADQLPLRTATLREFVRTEATEYLPFQAIVARGGMLPPVQSGGYTINEEMCYYLANVCTEEHASNLAAYIAHTIAQEYAIPHAFIYDAVTTDELPPVAKIGGIKGLPRRAMSHALNMRATAHKAAEKLGIPYSAGSFIVAHMGGGITLSVHHQGKAIDFFSDDEGPLSPERAGRQQAVQLVQYLAGQNLTLREQVRLLRGKGGFVTYFGTSDAKHVEDLANAGDEQARLLYDAMGYQVAKAIGELATVVYGKVDAILLTGGLARSKLLTQNIEKRTAFIAPTHIFPGENEMESLAYGALRILNGQEQAQHFHYPIPAPKS